MVSWAEGSGSDMTAGAGSVLSTLLGEQPVTARLVKTPVIRPSQSHRLLFLKPATESIPVRPIVTGHAVACRPGRQNSGSGTTPMLV